MLKEKRVCLEHTREVILRVEVEDLKLPFIPTVFAMVY